MALSSTSTADELTRDRSLSGSATTPSRTGGDAVSWGAIIAGAAAAASLSLILLMLGLGLGLSSVSPWKNDGISATTFGVSSIVWVTLTQLIASAMGGYLAGRLRTKWVAVHTDEVYFRDTAHGFLAWAVASLASAALLTSVVGSILSGGAQVGAAGVGGAASSATMAAGNAAAMSRAAGSTTGGQVASMDYFLDTLFRSGANTGAVSSSTSPTASTQSSNSTSEVARIFANAMSGTNLPAEDLKYAGQLVAQRTGLAQPEAEKRVADVYARARANLKELETGARAAADKARKASAYTALWLFISLLIGAFVASLAATYGGRRRDL